MEKAILAKVEKTVNTIVEEVSEKEKRQDEVIQLQREIIRNCALAIRHIHTGDSTGAKKVLNDIEALVKKMHAIDDGFKHISGQCYQEYVELKALEAIFDKKPVPSQEELGIDYIAYLNGLADTVGELRRACQIALSKQEKKEAQYYFDVMSELYDQLMLVKFSSSLVGPLKHKQDVIRGQLEQSRSEMLRS